MPFFNKPLANKKDTVVAGKEVHACSDFFPYRFVPIFDGCQVLYCGGEYDAFTLATGGNTERG